MFSRKSKIYLEIESELKLELHKEGIKNLQLSQQFRKLCIISIILSLITPWYYEPFRYLSVYLFMICDSGFIPSGCHNFYSLQQSCSLSKTICSECDSNMRAGIIMFVFSFLSILCHLISFWVVKSATVTQQSKIKVSFIYISCINYILGFVIWVFVSPFDSQYDRPNYGLMAAFSAIFMNVFVAFHFYTFYGFLLDNYPSIEESLNVEKEDEKDEEKQE